MQTFHIPEIKVPTVDKQGNPIVDEDGNPVLGCVPEQIGLPENKWFTLIGSDRNGSEVLFDINLDGKTDFFFRTGSFGFDGTGFRIYPTNSATVWARMAGPLDSNTLAIPLNPDDVVQADLPTGSIWDDDGTYSTTLCTGFDVGASGPFCAKEAAVGLRFQIGTNTHYGWIFLDVPGGLNTGNVLSFAYEDQPDTAITVIPEPGSVAMWLGGAGLLTLYRRERARCRKHPDDVS